MILPGVMDSSLHYYSSKKKIQATTSGCVSCLLTISCLLMTGFLLVTVFFNPLLQQIYILRREQTATSDTISSQGKDMFARICCRLRRIWPPITDYIRPSYHTGDKSAPTVSCQECSQGCPFCTQRCQNASPTQPAASIALQSLPTPL